jgi:hypothetical protein
VPGMAIADSSLTGCWGGLSDRQRAELRRQGKGGVSPALVTDWSRIS